MPYVYPYLGAPNPRYIPRVKHATMANLPRHYDHAERIKSELKALGMSRIGLWRPESLYLPKLIHEDEALKGVVYGHDAFGTAMILATDRRFLHINKKPLFIEEDEVSYDMVAGVSYFRGLISTVVLHTRVEDYRVQTYNQVTALRFVDYIETRCLDQKGAISKHYPTSLKKTASG